MTTWADLTAPWHTIYLPWGDLDGWQPPRDITVTARLATPTGANVRQGASATLNTARRHAHPADPHIASVRRPATATLER